MAELAFGRRGNPGIVLAEDGGANGIAKPPVWGGVLNAPKVMVSAVMAVERGAVAAGIALSVKVHRWLTRMTISWRAKDAATSGGDRSWRAF